MAIAEGYVEAPDTSNWPKNPTNYPFPVGSNYAGEDPSGYWVYGPDNLYHPNQNILSDYNESSGLAEPKPKKPGIGSVLGPVAAGAGALGLSQGFFNDPNKFVEGLGNLPGTVSNAASNIFGLGSKPVTTGATTAATAAQAATGAAPTAATAGASLASSAPFSFNPAATGITGAAPAVPDLLSAGYSGAAPAAPEIVSATAATEAPGLLSQAVPFIGPAVGAYGAYNLFSNNENLSDGSSALQGAASGAAMGSYFGPWGTAIGAVIGGVAGLAHSQFGSSKGKEQLERDQVRSYLQDNGILDDQYMLTLADGTKFDVGKDGNALLDNVGANIDGNRQRHYYDVDFSDPANEMRVAALNPLAYIIAGGNDKRASDLVGMLTNAIASSKDKDSNIASLYQQFGMDHGTAYNAIDQMVKDEKLDATKADAFKNGLDELYGVGAYAGGNKPKPVAPPPPVQSAPAPTPAQPQQSPKYPGTPRPQPALPNQQPVTTKPQPTPVQQPTAPFSMGPRSDAPRKPSLVGLRR